MNALLRTSELAATLGVPKSAVTKLVRMGLLTPSTPGKFPPDTDERLRHQLPSLRFLATVTPDSWHRLCSDGLTYTLLPRHSEVTASLMRPGCRIVFYVMQAYKFCAVAEVTGKPRRKNVVWRHGVFSFVVPLTPVRMVGVEHGISVRDLVADLEFVRNPSAWGQYFRGAIRIITARDYAAIADTLSKSSSH